MFVFYLGKDDKLYFLFNIFLKISFSTSDN